jgi:hypothetical protein
MTNAPRGKLVFWIVVGTFAAVLAAAAVWSWSIVGTVRVRAEVTDSRLRELAWMVLSYADRHDGFPLSESELRSFVDDTTPLPETLEKKPLGTGGRTFPTSRLEEGAPAPPLALRDALESIEVEWPIERDVPPILRPRGLPTQQGTRQMVGEWLYAMTERIRAG